MLLLHKPRPQLLSRLISCALVTSSRPYSLHVATVFRKPPPGPSFSTPFNRPNTATPSLIFTVARMHQTSANSQKHQENDEKQVAPSSQPPDLKLHSTDPKNIVKNLRSIPPIRENIYTIPNLLTFSRILSAPFIGYLIIHEHYPLALGLFVLSGATDLLDGYIARRYNMKTFVGSIIDPAADKALMTVLTVSLAAQGLLPLPLAVIILGRDAGLILSSFYYRYISLPPPKTFLRYWDFSITSAEVKPTTISKINTALQLMLMGASLTSPVFAWPDPVALAGLQWTVAATTVWSGLSYVFSKDAVKILHDTRK